MKKFILLFFSITLLTACSGNDNTETPDSKPVEPVEQVDKTVKENESTETADDTIRHADFQTAIPAEWNVKLPSMYPVEEGKYVTAKTTTTADEVTYDFYEFEEEVSLDDARVEEGIYIGQLIVKQFEDQFTADDTLKTTLTLNDDYVAMGPLLVYPFKEGEESVVNWNDNQGWYIFVRSMEKSPTELVEWIEGENLVLHLADGVLNGQYPKPQILGQMHFNVDDQAKTSVTWAANEIVYTLQDFEERTLKWLGAFGEAN